MSTVMQLALAPEPVQAGHHRVLAKLSAPRAAAHQVARTALCESIVGAEDMRLVLLMGPAGYGKTTVMRQVKDAFERDGVLTAWINCDEADNDLGRFLAFVMAAIRRIAGQQDDGAAVIGADTAVGAVALDLIDRVGTMARPFALFFDDFEAVQSAAALALVRRLIEQLPPDGRVVLGTRTTPDIGLARLRAHGEVLEVGATQLRFSASEADRFFSARATVTLNDDDRRSLYRSTEGWPAALWLASVALERSADPGDFVRRFAGADAALADYLVEEVLSQYSPDIREFMLRTSILGQLGGPLCDAVTGRSDSAELLDHLERSGVFITRLDGERQWLRYHSLFAGFLRTQLHRHSKTTEIARLHLAAAQWFLSEHRPIPAIEHALASGDFAFAVPLLTRHAEKLLGEGRPRLLLRLIEMVPEAQLARLPKLKIARLWAVSFTRGARASMTLLDQLSAEVEADDEFRTHAMALRPMLLSMLDLHDESFESARKAMGALPRRAGFADAILRTSLAYEALVLGRYGEAQTILDTRTPGQSGSYDAFTTIFSQSVEGAIDLVQGRLRQATVRFKLAAGADTRRGSTFTNGNAMAGILLAEVLYEADEIEQAERLLKVYVPLMQELGVPGHLISGHRNLARIQAHRGDVDASLQTLTELEALGHDLGLGRLASSAHLERSRMALLQGDLDAAHEDLQRARRQLDWDRYEQWTLLGNDGEACFEAQMRYLIHAGKAAQAVEPLRQQLEHAERMRRGRRALKLRILLALALDGSERANGAMRMLRDALQTGVQERFVRCFLDEGERFRQLFRRLVSSQGLEFDDTPADELHKFCARLNQQRAAVDRPVPAANGNALAQAVEPLTRKELQVLKLLAEGLSNAALAERMFVSKTTIRTHLRNVHAKLMVSNRTQAIAVARRLGLLD